MSARARKELTRPPVRGRSGGAEDADAWHGEPPRSSLIRVVRALIAAWTQTTVDDVPQQPAATQAPCALRHSPTCGSVRVRCADRDGVNPRRAGSALTPFGPKATNAPRRSDGRCGSDSGPRRSRRLGPPSRTRLDGSGLADGSSCSTGGSSAAPHVTAATAARGTRSQANRPRPPAGWRRGAGEAIVHPPLRYTPNIP
jgi:hypothetical protein